MIAFIDYNSVFFEGIFLYPVVMLLIVGLSTYATPGHKLEYEKNDLNLENYSVIEKIKITNVRESECLNIYILCSSFFLWCLVLIIRTTEYLVSIKEISLLMRWFDYLRTISGIIIVILLLTIGYVIEKTYILITSRDLLLTKHKKLVLYSVCLSTAIFFLNKVVFIFILTILLGKFLWLDTYITYKQKKFSLKKQLILTMEEVKKNYLIKETLRSCAALLTFVIIRVILIYIIKVKTPNLAMMSIMLWYLLPSLSNWRDSLKSN